LSTFEDLKNSVEEVADCVDTDPPRVKTSGVATVLLGDY